AENAVFLRELFRYLQAMWYPQTREMAVLEMQHSKLYAELVDKLGAARDEELPRLARTFFRIKKNWQPQPEFFIHSRMIELMHRVFRDLELETTAEHPHQEGWMSTFRDWAKDRNFKHTWSVVQGNYDIQFRNFCRREFGLDAHAGTHDFERVHHG
ncbi:MAG: hypothetical protein LUO89_15530, partial [Methanothrix sp.]|nr:hypothetical protein [Methanothrix sp.]